MMVLFLYAGSSKLLEYRSFTDQLHLSPLLNGMAPYIAWLVPVIEIATAVLLIIQRFRLVGLWVSLLLMAAFTGYVLIILGFSKELPCSCGGILQTMDWQEHLVFNVVFLGLAAAGALLKRRAKIDTDNARSAISLKDR